MTFPLKNFKFNIPINDDLGAFGVPRKFDVHTGVDLYCEENEEVFSIEDGVIVAIEWFTGQMVNMPWWNDTMAIAISGKSGVINYGEVIPEINLKVGDKIKEGDLIGSVVRVLKKDKGKVPSTSMLHLELYSAYSGDWVMWNLNEIKPKNLLNPTELLIKIKNND